MTDEPERITLAETDDGEHWWARRKSDGRTARGATAEGALRTVLSRTSLGHLEFDHADPPEGIFSTAKGPREDDDYPPGRPDYYDKNPGWVDDLPDLGENG
jgi:hypothetical protein